MMIRPNSVLSGGGKRSTPGMPVVDPRLLVSPQRAGEGQDMLVVRDELVKWLWIDHTGRLRPFLKEAVALHTNGVELRTFLLGIAPEE